MKDKQFIFFDNTDVCALYDSIQDFVFEAYGQDNERKSKTDIPEDYVWNEVYCHLDEEYADFIILLCSSRLCANQLRSASAIPLSVSCLSSYLSEPS